MMSVEQLLLLGPFTLEANSECRNDEARPLVGVNA